MFREKHDVAPARFGSLCVRDYWQGESLSASVALIEVDSGAAHPRALSHLSDKYYFVVTGHVEFTVGTTQGLLGPGDTAHIPKETPFSYRNMMASSAELLLVHVPPFDADEEEFLE